ncbi:hypothetical protein BDF14DRAFT_1752365 [Spinellus fusiger]|nr:hypothetical protein BDF14DRAFT_1752365 [Spinellus fusiger]
MRYYKSLIVFDLSIKGVPPANVWLNSVLYSFNCILTFYLFSTTILLVFYLFSTDFLLL